MSFVVDQVARVRARRGAIESYSRSVADHRQFARDHAEAGHALLARRHAYWAGIAERAAIAEQNDPQPRR
jgi:hypothetical protein